jgi:aspartyl-tRNA(Asn)/glutamyl-tRNA(Gln) amidotransferase subunit A
VVKSMIAFDELGVVGIARAIANGELSSTEVVEEALSRVGAWEERIHAWSYLDSDGARREAALLSEEAVAGRLRGPLHGVPIGIKDEFLVRGMPTGMRGPERPDAETSDATAVERLRAAGAVILGKTHMPIDGVPPPTRNPWNTEHTAGGSSSGSGAAVGARTVPAALAEQTGGSNLRPAAYCGVVGLKPTYGRIGRYGCFPFAWSLDHPGIISLTVADAALLLSVLAGPDPRDSTSLVAKVPPATVAAMDAPPRVGFVRSHFYDTCEPEMVSSIEQAVERLAEAGAPVKEVLLPQSFALTWTAHRLIGAAERSLISPEVDDSEERLHIRSATGRTGIPASVGALLPASYYLQARRVRRWLQQELTGCWDDFDVLVMPVAPDVAPKGMATGDATLLVPWSLLGYPSMSIPFGFSADGLPLGIQLAAPLGREYELLQAASWMEGVFGRLPEPKPILN